MSASASVPVLLRLVSETTAIVNVAGKIVRAVLQTGNLGLVDKGVNDLQTKADRCAQEYIISKLEKQFPKACIIGEEPDDGATNQEDHADLIASSSAGQASIPFPEILAMNNIPDSISSISEDQIVIWVDPLDGTREFTEGTTEGVTVLVGIAVGGIPVGGVIHQPFYGKDGHFGRTVWGIPGLGAFGGMKIIESPKNKRSITTTKSHGSAHIEQTLASLKPDEIIRVGGAGYKVMLLMEGKVNAYIYPSAGCKKWDTCACEAVLHAAGGRLTDMKGRSYDYSKEAEHLNADGTIATAPGEDHDWYVNTIPQ